MKKLLSLVLSIVMLVSCGANVFADSVDSDAMEAALVCVKEKVDIPDDFTVFEPYVYEYEDDKSYTFNWATESGDAYIDVVVDGEGRLERYYFYDKMLKADKKLTVLSKSDIVAFAEEFLKKAIPEMYEDETDVLVFDPESWGVYNNSYDFSFFRYKNGILVRENSVSVNVAVYDDVPYMKSLFIYLDYDAEFEEVPEDVAGYEDIYREKFPVELIYQDEGYDSLSKNDADDKVALVYRHKNCEAGYILAKNGEVVESDSYNVNFSNGAVAEPLLDSVLNGFESYKEMLNKAEIDELVKVNELISQDEALKILKSIPYIDIDDNMKVSRYRINKQNEKYYTNIRLEHDERYVSATFDGKSGEMLHLYCSLWYEEEEGELTEAEKAIAEKKINEFLKVVVKGKLGEFSEQSEYTYGKQINKGYNRVVNGVRYVDDSINITFDSEKQLITQFSLDYEEKSFPDSKKVVSDKDAYDKMLEIAPLQKIYINTEDVFKVCFVLSEMVMIDAMNGEKYLTEKENANEDVTGYSDVVGHWAEEEINKLAEVNIGFAGGVFRPDEKITQSDVLKLFMSGIESQNYISYEDMIDEGILTEEEKNPNGEVKREDAAVYMIRICNLDDVARMSHIFKVDYKDKEQLSPQKAGYCAILSGFGVLEGDDEGLRPQDSLTRAEAAVMLYKYLMK